MTTLLADREIERLMALHPKGFDLSLERITRLLERLGNPHLLLPPVIHIAGTNGKGSACAFSRALLEEAGYRVHVHTSPHLVNWHERYRLGEAGRRALPEKLEERTRAMFRLLEDGARTGAMPWARLWDEGHGRHWGGAAAYIGANLGAWRSVL